MNASSGSPAKPLVSVLTPSIQERGKFRYQCGRSVRSQCFFTAPGAEVEHIVHLDLEQIGCAAAMNICAKRAKGEWFIPLADDDLLLPGAVESLLEQSADADIVYAPPLVTGNEDRWWFFQAPPAIPSFGLIRRTLWEQIGGYDESLAHEEDRDFWTKALDLGARFVRVDEPVWVYRQHSANKSFNKRLVAA